MSGHRTMSASEFTRLRKAITLATGPSRPPGTGFKEDLLEKKIGQAEYRFDTTIVKKCCTDTSSLSRQLSFELTISTDSPRLRNIPMGITPMGNYPVSSIVTNQWVSKMRKQNRTRSASRDLPTPRDTEFYIVGGDNSIIQLGDGSEYTINTSGGFYSSITLPNPLPPGKIKIYGENIKSFQCAGENVIDIHINPESCQNLEELGIFSTNIESILLPPLPELKELSITDYSASGNLKALAIAAQPTLSACEISFWSDLTTVFLASQPTSALIELTNNPKLSEDSIIYVSDFTEDMDGCTTIGNGGGNVIISSD
jgi:hypothetical protein